MQDVSVIEINKEGKRRSKELPSTSRNFSLCRSVPAQLLRVTLRMDSETCVKQTLIFGNFLPIVMKQNA